MNYDVFISHSSKDKQVADAICSKMEQNRIKCWIAPRDIMPGKDYQDVIVEAVKKCKIMILLYSESSIESRDVKSEIHVAYNNGILILPFKISNTILEGKFEYCLSSIHWIDAIDPPLEKHIIHLVVETKRILDAMNDIDKCNESDEVHSVGQIESFEKNSKRGIKNKIGSDEIKFILRGLGVVILLGVAINVLPILKATYGNSEEVKSESEISLGKEVTNNKQSENILDRNTVEQTEQEIINESNESIIAKKMETDADADVFLINAQRSASNFTISYGNSNGNRANGARIVQDEEWLYFCHPDNHFLYKEKLNGEARTQLTDYAVNELYLVDFWIYYREDQNGHLMRINRDGTGENKVIYSNMNFDLDKESEWVYFYPFFHYYNEKIFYIDVFRKANSNEQYPRIMEAGIGGANKTVVLNFPVQSMFIRDGMIYFLKEGGQYIEKYDISSYRIERLIGPQSMDCLQLIGNWLYFINCSDEKIYRMSLDGLHLELVIQDWVNPNALHVTDDGWIYYRNQKDNGLYRIRLDGSEKKLMTNLNLESNYGLVINVANDRIYFNDLKFNNGINSDNGTAHVMYKMRLDGSGREEWH